AEPHAPAAEDSAQSGAEAADGFGEGADVDAARVTADGVDRVVITTGSATVVVEDPVAASEEVVGLVETYEGRVDSRHQTNEEERPSAELVLRIPPEQVDPFVEDLGEVGEVDEVAIDAEDVTGTVRDLDAEIAALETSVAR